MADQIAAPHNPPCQPAKPDVENSRANRAPSRGWLGDGHAVSPCFSICTVVLTRARGEVWYSSNLLACSAIALRFAAE